MSISDGYGKYSIDQVATSLNYGQPMTAVQRSVNRVVSVAMYVCIAVLFVATIACLCFKESMSTALYTGLAMLLPVALILILKRTTFLRNKVEQSIKACLSDAVEIDANMKYEFYLFDSGDNIMSYVVHFDMDGTEYAVTYAKPVVNTDPMVDLVVSNRPDLAVFNGKFFKALYSPKYNDVLILTAQQHTQESAEIE